MGSTTPDHHTALPPRRAQSQPGDGEDVHAAWIQGNASLAPNLMVLFRLPKNQYQDVQNQDQSLGADQIHQKTPKSSCTACVALEADLRNCRSRLRISNFEPGQIPYDAQCIMRYDRCSNRRGLRISKQSLSHHWLRPANRPLPARDKGLLAVRCAKGILAFGPVDSRLTRFLGKVSHPRELSSVSRRANNGVGAQRF